MFSDFPLVKFFPYNSAYVVYDARSNYIFILGEDEFRKLTNWINDNNGSLNDEVLKTFKKLNSFGIFKPGVFGSVSPSDHESISRRVDFLKDDVLLRKFVLEVTEDCNLRCKYCLNTLAIQGRVHNERHMSYEDACKGIQYYFSTYTSFIEKLSKEKKDLVIQKFPPSLSWYGGEPFLNFDLVKKTAEYFKSLDWRYYGIDNTLIKFVLNTNLTILTDDQIEFLDANKVLLYVSIDGPKDVHDRSRISKNGLGTYEVVKRNMDRLINHSFKYYNDHIQILTVLQDQKDRDEVTSFIKEKFQKTPMLLEMKCPNSFINNPEKRIEEINTAIEGGLQYFQAAIKDKNIDEILSANPSLYKYHSLNTKKPIGRDDAMIDLSCPMGMDNLMLCANGNYVICHKIDGSFSIGTASEGVRMEKIKDLYFTYNKNINENCKSCWAVRFCTMCPAPRIKNEKIVQPTMKECECIKKEVEYDFYCLFRLMASYDDLFKLIGKHRMNLDFHAGIICKNEISRFYTNSSK